MPPRRRPPNTCKTSCHPPWPNQIGRPKMSVRIGVVGVGWWATFSHIPTTQADPRATLVAIADLSAERLAIVGDRFNVAQRYTDYRVMIDSQKLDGLIVATPPAAHQEIAAPALAKGLQ